MNMHQKLNLNIIPLLGALAITAACSSGPGVKRHGQGSNTVEAYSYSRHSEEQLERQARANDPLALCHRRDFSDAYQMLNSAPKEAPQTLNGLGVCHLLEGKSEQAFFYFRRALNGIEQSKDAKQHAPLKAMVHNNLGLLFLSRGHSVDAYEYFEESWKIMPNPVAALNLAGLAVEFAHYQRALELLSKMDQKDQDVLGLKIRAHIGLGQHRQAAEHFKQLSAHWQTRDDIASSMAWSYQQVGQPALALELLQKRRPLDFNLNQQRTDNLLGQLENMVEEKDQEKPTLVERKTASQVSENVNAAEKKQPQATHR